MIRLTSSISIHYPTNYIPLPEGDLPQAIMLMATKQKHKSFVLGIYVTSMV